MAHVSTVFVNFVMCLDGIGVDRHRVTFLRSKKYDQRLATGAPDDAWIR